MNAIRQRFLEVLEVQLFDILGQGQFPGFLLRVGQAAKLLRIQPQLSGHLDVGMGKTALTRRARKHSFLSAAIIEPEEVHKILSHLVKIGCLPPAFDPASLN